MGRLGDTMEIYLSRHPGKYEQNETNLEKDRKDNM